MPLGWIPSTAENNAFWKERASTTSEMIECFPIFSFFIMYYFLVLYLYPQFLWGKECIIRRSRIKKDHLSILEIILLWQIILKIRWFSLTLEKILKFTGNYRKLQRFEQSFFFVVLGIKPKVSHMPSKYSTLWFEQSLKLIKNGIKTLPFYTTMLFPDASTKPIFGVNNPGDKCGISVIQYSIA